MIMPKVTIASKLPARRCNTTTVQLIAYIYPHIAEGEHLETLDVRDMSIGSPRQEGVYLERYQTPAHPLENARSLTNSRQYNSKQTSGLTQIFQQLLASCAPTTDLPRPPPRSARLLPARRPGYHQ